MGETSALACLWAASICVSGGWPPGKFPPPSWQPFFSSAVSPIWPICTARGRSAIICSAAPAFRGVFHCHRPGVQPPDAQRQMDLRCRHRRAGDAAAPFSGYPEGCHVCRFVDECRYPIDQPLDHSASFRRCVSGSNHGKRRQPSGGFRNSNLGQAWLVLMLALVFGACACRPSRPTCRYHRANKLNETLDKGPRTGLGNRRGRQRMTKRERCRGDYTGRPGSGCRGKTVESYPLFRVEPDGELAGWVVKAGGQGYADKIELLVGLDPARKPLRTFRSGAERDAGAGQQNHHLPTGAASSPVSKPRTAGGAKRRTFSAQRVAFIDAITGATISSRSVTAIVNQVVSDSGPILTPDAFRPRKGG
jgi:electron transport complex protein RnfG